MGHILGWPPAAGRPHVRHPPRSVKVRHRGHLQCPLHRSPTVIDATLGLLAKADYIADRSLATVLYLALKMGRPLFVEGEAGTGKTEIAKVLSQTLGRKLIRLQCYEGLDVSAAVYEWNYGAQMIAIRLAEAEGEGDRERIEHDVFSERFLIKRPLLQALEPDPDGPPVLLIDEIDRTDEAFEAFLLEVLADFQVTVPELGTIKAPHPPIVVITSNRTREVHDALKRRCLYHWVGYPERRARTEDLARQGAGHRQETVRAGGRLRAEPCARKTCSRCRASPRRWIGPARSPSSTWWRSIRRRCPTRSARCSNTRTTSPASTAARSRRCSTR